MAVSEETYDEYVDVDTMQQEQEEQNAVDGVAEVMEFLEDLGVTDTETPSEWDPESGDVPNLADLVNPDWSTESGDKPWLTDPDYQPEEIDPSALSEALEDLMEQGIPGLEPVEDPDEQYRIN